MAALTEDCGSGVEGQRNTLQRVVQWPVACRVVGTPVSSGLGLDPGLCKAGLVTGSQRDIESTGVGQTLRGWTRQPICAEGPAPRGGPVACFLTEGLFLPPPLESPPGIRGALPCPKWAAQGSSSPSGDPESHQARRKRRSSALRGPCWVCWVWQRVASAALLHKLLEAPAGRFEVRKLPS